LKKSFELHVTKNAKKSKKSLFNDFQEKIENHDLEFGSMEEFTRKQNHFKFNGKKVRKSLFNSSESN
jgi:hypothetical protein